MVLGFKFTDIEDKLPPSDERTVLVDFIIFLHCYMDHVGVTVTGRIMVT